MELTQYVESLRRELTTAAEVGGEHQAAENGLYTLPLATVERIAASA